MIAGGVKDLEACGVLCRWVRQQGYSLLSLSWSVGWCDSELVSCAAVVGGARELQYMWVQVRWLLWVGVMVGVQA